MPSICGMLTSTIGDRQAMHKQLFQRLQAVEGLVDLEAGALQGLAVIDPHQAGVVDDQHRCFVRLPSQAFLLRL